MVIIVVSLRHAWRPSTQLARLLLTIHTYSTYIATLCILTTRPFAAERYLETSRLLYIRLLYTIACTRRLCTQTASHSTIDLYYLALCCVK